MITESVASVAAFGIIEIWTRVPSNSCWSTRTWMVLPSQVTFGVKAVLAEKVSPMTRMSTPFGYQVVPWTGACRTWMRVGAVIEVSTWKLHMN